MTLCGDNRLYDEASLKKSGSSLLNSARKQWSQCLRNIKIKFKCKKKGVSDQQICSKFSWRIKVLYQWVSVIFLSSLAMFTTTYKHKNLHWTLPVLTVDDRKRYRAHKRYVNTSVVPHRYPYCGNKNFNNYVHNNQQ